MEAKARDTGKLSKMDKKAKLDEKNADIELREMESREKKPKGALAGAVATLCVVFGVFAVLTFLIVFNVADLKLKVIDLLAQGISPYTEIEAYVVEKQAELDAKEAELSGRETKIAETEEEIKKRDNASKIMESQANKRYEEAAAYMAGLEELNVEISKLAEIYAKMEPASAGRIIAQMTEVKYMVRVLRRMEEKKVAAILQTIDPELAAIISKKMME